MSKSAKRRASAKTNERPTSQYEQVLSHLRKNGTITSDQAFRRYGVTRLSAVVYNLREEGAEIENQRHTKKNRFGRTVGYDKYVLVNNF